MGSKEIIRRLYTKSTRPPPPRPIPLGANETLPQPDPSFLYKVSDPLVHYFILTSVCQEVNTAGLRWEKAQEDDARRRRRHISGDDELRYCADRGNNDGGGAAYHSGQLGFKPGKRGLQISLMDVQISFCSHYRRLEQFESAAAFASSSVTSGMRLSS